MERKIPRNFWGFFYALMFYQPEKKGFNADSVLPLVAIGIDKVCSPIP